jgi:hypothetical protein
MKSGD